MDVFSILRPRPLKVPRNEEPSSVYSPFLVVPNKTLNTGVKGQELIFASLQRRTIVIAVYMSLLTLCLIFYWLQRSCWRVDGKMPETAAAFTALMAVAAAPITPFAAVFPNLMAVTALPRKKNCFRHSNQPISMTDVTLSYIHRSICVCSSEWSMKANDAKLRQWLFNKEWFIWR